MSIIHRIDNLFSDEELNEIKSIINNFEFLKKEDGSYVTSKENLGTGTDPVLGRMLIGDIRVNENIQLKLESLIKDIFNLDLSLSNSGYSNYSAKWGEPNLPTHYDGDFTDIIINFQLESNTKWQLGLDLDLYDLEDNSAMIFNPNKTAHWRPIKKFKDGDYVDMIFFRFINKNNELDNSHLKYNVYDKIFEDINNFRDSLSQ